MKALNVELGLIIDLTYTTRYYEVKVLVRVIANFVIVTAIVVLKYFCIYSP